MRFFIEIIFMTFILMFVIENLCRRDTLDYLDIFWVLRTNFLTDK